MLVRLEQFLKVFCPKLSRLLPTIVMFLRLEQFSKAKFSMLLTLSGIAMLVRLVHSKKAELPMVLRLLPTIVMLVSLEQYAKAL